MNSSLWKSFSLYLSVPEFSKMYMAYGWPQVIPLELPNCPSTQQIVYFKVVNSLLLVVAPTHIELWTASQVHLLNDIADFLAELWISRFLCLIWLFGPVCFVVYILARFVLILFTAQSEAGEVQERCGFNSKRGGEFAGSLEPRY